MPRSEAPREATHWRLRLKAQYHWISIWQVEQVWAADLKSHRLKTLKIINDPHFAGKAANVV